MDDSDEIDLTTPSTESTIDLTTSAKRQKYSLKDRKNLGDLALKNEKEYLEENAKL